MLIITHITLFKLIQFTDISFFVFFNVKSNTYFVSSLNIKLYLLGDLDLNSNAVEEYEMISCGIRFGML